MAKTDRTSGGGGGSGMDLLRDELMDYLGAQIESLADKAGDKLSDVTDQLLDSAENGGPLPGLPGGGIVKSLVGSKLKGMKDNVVGKAQDLIGGGGGKSGKSGGGKSMNMVEVLDVGVPVRMAYDYWTQYEAFSDFAKGVRSVSKEDEVHSDWKAKVGPSSRSWKATVQEQVPDERILWTSEGSKGTTRGCVSFHEVTSDLTRIVLVVEYYPSGFFEKTGNLWRAQGRRLRLDFKLFQRYVTFAEEEPEGWRGEIRDGEVVRTHEEAMEEEEAEADGEEEGEEVDEYDEEQEPYEGEDGDLDEDEDEYEEEEEEDQDGR
ncbi:SRPBCC family protein [Streptomyces sp. NPDC091376]|uniref:SRPBCC family protein n=1 Tax=Streptomyces sp. NPDC091376 TaxID=3365994 RepID=UPI0038226566